MNQLVSRRPQALRSVFGLGREFERALDDFFGDAARDMEASAGTWMPPVDVRHTDDAVEIWMDLPGMSKDAVDIRIEGNVLTIAGERSFDRQQDGNWHHAERVFGRFERSFSLSGQLDAGKADATYREGVLHVSVPRAEEAKPRRLQIKAG
jgi:HSP20 family protein